MNENNKHLEFQELCQPLMNWLENFHPHMSIVVDSVTSILVEGQMSCKNKNLIDELDGDDHE